MKNRVLLTGLFIALFSLVARGETTTPICVPAPSTFCPTVTVSVPEMPALVGPLFIVGIFVGTLLIRRYLVGAKK